MMITEKTYYDSGKIKTEYQIENGKRHGIHILYHENGIVALEGFYFEDKPVGPYKVWYENGQKEEEGEYLDGKYKIKNFWTEKGEHILVEGTGTAIRKYGPLDSDVYEEYYRDGIFQGKKKISSFIYLGFKPDKP